MPILELAVIGFASFFFTLPFHRFPPDDHFANYSSWALFRKRGEALPTRFFYLNQGGFTRMFLYYLAAAVHYGVGRERLLAALRLLITIINTLIAVLIYFIATVLLGAHSSVALICTLIYLFIATRPQFELLKYNPELFHAAGSLMGVAAVLYFRAKGMDAVWWLLPVFTGMVFVGFNCKILFCVDSAALATALFIDGGFDFKVLLIYPAAVALALMLFIGMYRNLSLQNLRSLKHYLGHFSDEKIIPNFLYNYKTFYYKTPLSGYFLLYLIGLAAAVPHPAFLLLLFWSLAGVAVVIQQKRFCTYFFQICFAPLCLPMAVGLSRLHDVSPIIPWLLIAGFLILSRKSFIDFPSYYFTKPPIEHIKRAYGSFFFLTSHDFRVEDIAAHFQSHKKRFMVWQTDLLSHYVTGQAPICLIGSMVYHAHVMYPQRQKLLIDAALEKRPQWLYDFSGYCWGKYQFNPVSFYLSCGLAFAPEKIKDNVLYYRLRKANTRTPARKRDLWGLYVTRSVVLDAFLDEFKAVFGNRAMLPPILHRDITDLCKDLITGKALRIDNFPEETLESEYLRQPNIGMLYLCVLALDRGARTLAARRLNTWMENSHMLLQLYPALTFTVFVLQILSGISPGRVLWPRDDILHVTFPRDLTRIARLCETVAGADVLSDSDTLRLLDGFRRYAPAATGYEYFKMYELNAVMGRLTHMATLLRDRSLPAQAVPVTSQQPTAVGKS